MRSASIWIRSASGTLATALKQRPSWIGSGPLKATAPCRIRPSSSGRTTCMARSAGPAPAGFCDQDLAGLWLNSSDMRLAYRFRDHGEVVRGEFLERQPDGGLQPP